MTLTGNPELVDSGFNTPSSCPINLLKQWLDAAEKLKVNEPRGVVLSTANKHGQPSSRVVLLKEIDEKGIIFGTSELSAKAKDFAVNPYVSGTLWWRETIQQINFQGQIHKLSSEISDKLFQGRERHAQALSSVSRQSAPLISDIEFKNKVKEIFNSNDEIKRPIWWNAYHIIIETIEFWHGGTDRFHKRLRYDLTNENWQHQFLQP